MRRWFLVALLLAGCAAERKQDDLYHPQQISWEDGRPAYSIGPFYTRAYMRKTLAHFCRGAGYQVLDEEDDRHLTTHHHGAAFGNVYGGRSDSKETHEITVFFRCRPREVSAPTPSDDDSEQSDDTSDDADASAPPARNRE